MNINKDRRERALEILIREAVLCAVQEKILSEQEEVHLPEPQGPASPTQPANQEQPAAQPQQTQPQQQNTVSADAMIEKLNVLRRGTSFKDPSVYNQFVAWYNGLTEEQRTSFNNNIDAINNIVESEPSNNEQQPTAGTNQPVTQPQQTQAPVTPVQAV